MYSIYSYILCTIFTSLVFCQTLDIETLERLVVDGNLYLATGLQLIEAQAAYTTISEGYLNGRFTYLDVVDTQRMWFESREQYIGALKNYHINILELDRIMGNTYGKETP